MLNAITLCHFEIVIVIIIRSFCCYGLDNSCFEILPHCKVASRVDDNDIVFYTIFLISVFSKVWYVWWFIKWIIHNTDSVMGCSDFELLVRKSGFRFFYNIEMFALNTSLVLFVLFIFIIAVVSAVHVGDCKRVTPRWFWYRIFYVYVFYICQWSLLAVWCLENILSHSCLQLLSFSLCS